MAWAEGLLLLLGANLLVLITADPVFYDSFDTSWEGRWIASEDIEYEGEWKHAKSKGHEDFGLLVPEKAKKYGLAIDLPQTVNFASDTVVLQYDLRLQKGLRCGGAYLKFLLPQEAGWTPSKFNNSSPYSIMFGPDKCGDTDKVHFIFRHKHPKTKQYVEHHLSDPPTPKGDKLSHVYTAVIYPNNTLQILVDGKVKKSADLMSSDFEPLVIPPKTIPDPDDKKPEDWDERAQIPDLTATKPDNWDENAPSEIDDLDAVKPFGWLDDEPDEIDDPKAKKPDIWDDEEEGEWEPPRVPNPRCLRAPGCGEWVRPQKTNPDYKGKWSTPLIDNPDNKGIWKPREISNPDFFELDQLHLESIAAIGIEIWTMQSGLLFDNILVTYSQEEAHDYRNKTWKPKFRAEKGVEEQEKKHKEAFTTKFKEKFFELLYRIPELHILAPYKMMIIDNVLGVAEKHQNLTVIVVLGAASSILAINLQIFLRLVFGCKKKKDQAAISKKVDESIPDDPAETTVEPEATDSTSEIAQESESLGVHRRKTRRES